jgi:hypothetical protein
MRGHGEKFTRLSPQVITGLLAGRTLDQLAVEVGIGVRTLDRWVASPEFKRMYREARRMAVEQAVARMSALAMQAVNVLERHMNGGTPALEIKAAVALLSNLKALGGAEIEERLAALEARLEQAGRAGQVNGRVA